MSNSKSDWVIVNEPFSVFNGEHGKGEYLETGMYLHIRNTYNEGEYYLVGDINNVNGACSCCDHSNNIEANSIVLRYKMIELPKD